MCNRAQPYFVEIVGSLHWPSVLAERVWAGTVLAIFAGFVALTPVGQTFAVAVAGHLISRIGFTAEGGLGFIFAFTLDHLAAEVSAHNSVKTEPASFVWFTAVDGRARPTILAAFIVNRGYFITRLTLTFTCVLWWRKLPRCSPNCGWHDWYIIMPLYTSIRNPVRQFDGSRATVSVVQILTLPHIAEAHGTAWLGPLSTRTLPASTFAHTDTNFVIAFHVRFSVFQIPVYFPLHWDRPTWVLGWWSV